MGSSTYAPFIYTLFLINLDNSSLKTTIYTAQSQENRIGSLKREMWVAPSSPEPWQMLIHLRLPLPSYKPSLI